MLSVIADGADHALPRLHQGGFPGVLVTSLRAFAACTSEIDAPDFRFWHKADVHTALMNVRFEGNNGHDADVTRCLFMTHRKLHLCTVVVAPVAPVVVARSSDRLKGRSDHFQRLAFGRDTKSRRDDAGG
jgi:hypothetical protein